MMPPTSYTMQGQVPMGQPI